MQSECYLWSVKMQAWVAKGGGGTSDINNAQTFDESIALDRARRQYNEFDGVQLIPVPLHFVNFVRGNG